MEHLNSSHITTADNGWSRSWFSVKVYLFPHINHIDLIWLIDLSLCRPVYVWKWNAAISYMDFILTKQHQLWIVQPKKINIINHQLFHLLNILHKHIPRCKLIEFRSTAKICSMLPLNSVVCNVLEWWETAYEWKQRKYELTERKQHRFNQNRDQYDLYR